MEMGPFSVTIVWSQWIPESTLGWIKTCLLKSADIKRVLINTSQKTTMSWKRSTRSSDRKKVSLPICLLQWSIFHVSCPLLPRTRIGDEVYGSFFMFLRLVAISPPSRFTKCFWQCQAFKVQWLFGHFLEHLQIPSKRYRAISSSFSCGLYWRDSDCSRNVFRTLGIQYCEEVFFFTTFILYAR